MNACVVGQLRFELLFKLMFWYWFYGHVKIVDFNFDFLTFGYCQTYVCFATKTQIAPPRDSHCTATNKNHVLIRVQILMCVWRKVRHIVLVTFVRLNLKYIYIIICYMYYNEFYFNFTEVGIFKSWTLNNKITII